MRIRGRRQEKLPPDEQLVRDHVPDLAPPVPLLKHPVPEVTHENDFQDRLKSMADLRLPCFIIRASGLLMGNGQTVQGHRAITEAAIDTLASTGQPYEFQDLMPVNGSNKLQDPIGVIHVDPTHPVGLRQRININHTVQGAGPVLIGVGGARATQITRQDAREFWGPRTNPDGTGRSTVSRLALMNRLRHNLTLPDLMQSDAYTAELTPGDILFMAERDEATPEGVIWHGFGTQLTPRETRTAYIAPIPSTPNPIKYINDGSWERLLQPPSSGDYFV